jgi:hypothetical protein
MDPEISVIDHGAELTHLGVTVPGAENKRGGKE